MLFKSIFVKPEPQVHGFTCDSLGGLTQVVCYPVQFNRPCTTGVMFYVGILAEVLVVTIVRYILLSTNSQGISFIACSFKNQGPYVLTSGAETRLICFSGSF